MLQKGEVFFPREGTKQLIAQLVDFGVEKHDDLADAFSILLQQLMGERNTTCEIIWIDFDEDRENVLTRAF